MDYARGMNRVSRANRPAIGLLLVTLITHVVAAWPGTLVLCYGADGHVRVEARDDDCCVADECACQVGDGAICASGAAAQAVAQSIPRDLCGDCLDVPLAASQDPVGGSQSAHPLPLPPVHDSLRLLIVEAFADVSYAMTAQPTRPGPAVRTGAPPPAALSLLTVVLRC